MRQVAGPGRRPRAAPRGYRASAGLTPRARGRRRLHSASLRSRAKFPPGRSLTNATRNRGAARPGHSRASVPSQVESRRRHAEDKDTLRGGKAAGHEPRAELKGPVARDSLPARERTEK